MNKNETKAIQDTIQAIQALFDASEDCSIDETLPVLILQLNTMLAPICYKLELTVID